MFLRWCRNWRRGRLLRTPIPETWEGILQRNLWFYSDLPDDARRLLQHKVRVFIAERYWEGCAGLTITEEMQLTIAGHACRMVLNFSGHYFDTVQTILIYPAAYLVPDRRPNPAGVVNEGMEMRLGEAWFRGPVILAWDTIQEDQSRRGHNVVVHEFAHILDFEDSGVDGTPLLDSREEYQTWGQVMKREYQRLNRAVRMGRRSLLDEYGTTNEAEFFAVASESFFERSEQLALEHPELYQVLSRFYRQNPAGVELPS